MGQLQKLVRWLRLRLSDDEFTLLQGGVGSFAVKVAGAGLSFASHVVLARILGAKSFGVYVYALNWMKIAVLVGTLGFTTASVRFVAEYVSSKRWPVLKSYLNYSRRFTTILSIAVAIVFGAAGGLWYISSNPEQAWAFVIAAIAVPLSVRTKVGEAELKGLKQVVRAKIPRSVIIPSLLIVTVSVFYYLGVTTYGTVGMGGYLLAVCISLGFIGWYRYQKMPNELEAVQEYSLKERRGYWLATARDMVLIAGFNMILLRADTIMVGALVDPAASGIYSVASKVAFLLVFGLVAVNSILSPIVSDLYSENRREELQNIVRRGAQASFFFAVVAGTVILLFQDWLLSAFGSEFIKGRGALWALLFGQLVNSFAGPALVLLNMSGYQRDSTWIMGISALVNITLNAILIPLFGLEGAGIATMSTILIWNIATVYMCGKRLKVYPIAIS